MHDTLLPFLLFGGTTYFAYFAWKRTGSLPPEHPRRKRARNRLIIVACLFICTQGATAAGERSGLEWLPGVGMLAWFALAWWLKRHTPTEAEAQGDEPSSRPVAVRARALADLLAAFQSTPHAPQRQPPSHPAHNHASLTGRRNGHTLRKE